MKRESSRGGKESGEGARRLIRTAKLTQLRKIHRDHLLAREERTALRAFATTVLQPQIDALLAEEVAAATEGDALEADTAA